jgi:hypothetical protein
MWTVSRVASHSAYGSAGQAARLSEGFKNHLVDIAPGPVLARFDRFDEWVFVRVKVLCRVLVLGGIAAADVPATKTQPQVDPFIAHLQALFAAVGVGFYVLNLIEVGTALHGSILNLDL